MSAIDIALIMGKRGKGGKERNSSGSWLATVQNNTPNKKPVCHLAFVTSHEFIGALMAPMSSV